MTQPLPVPDTPTARPHEWFEDAVVQLLPELANAAMRLAKNRADAEDLVADAVARAWASLKTLRDRTAFRGWIFRVLTNCFISQCRAKAVRPVFEPLEDEYGAADSFSLFEKLHQPFLLWWSSNPEQEFLNKLLREDLERAVDSLPEAFRIVVVLADIEGFTYQEIANTVEVPVGTVRSRLARGRALLQKALWMHAPGGKRTRPETEKVVP